MERSTVGSLLRSTQALCTQLSEKETLEHGIAYYSERLALAPEANQFREVVIDDPAAADRAYAEAEGWFQARGLRCHAWAPAGGASTPTLDELLKTRGFIATEYTALILSRWVEFEPVEGVRVLPGRAMRAALERTFLDHDAPPGEPAPPMSAAVCTQRMDDPQFDMFVAMHSEAPAGRCAFYQVGDLARVMDLFVLPNHAGVGVEQALIAHVLAMAKRLAIRNIHTQIDSGDRAALDFFQRAGFEADGTIVEYHRKTPAREDPAS